MAFSSELVEEHIVTIVTYSAKLGRMEVQEGVTEFEAAKEARSRVQQQYNIILQDNPGSCKLRQ